MKKGILIVISGPSGVGKGTICSRLRSKNLQLYYSVSATTRSARANEREGINYYFMAKNEFEQLIEEDQFLEYADVYGNYYGTPRKKVEEMLDEGKDVILEIDIQGALQVKNKIPYGVFIFVMPPSIKELRNRIVSRGTDSEESIAKRLSCVSSEVKLANEYDYMVINDDLERCTDEINAVLVAEKRRVERNLGFIQELLLGSD